MAHIGKKYKKVAEAVDRNKRYKLDEALSLAGRGNPTRVQPFALNLTQPTDFGTLYSVGEIAALAALLAVVGAFRVGASRLLPEEGGTR